MPTRPTTPSPTTCADLLSLTAHELRTPASVISGYLRMLGDLASGNEMQLRMIAEAERSCGRVVALADELSAIGALETGSLTFATDRFDAFAVAAQAVKAVCERQPRPVPIVLRGESSGGPVTADRCRVQAAIEAIVSAVSRPQPETVTVVVHCSRQSIGSRPEAVIVVTPEGDLERARTADLGPLDERRSGLGLTLPLARRVIERHNGRIGCLEIGEKLRPILIALPLTRA